VAKRLTFDVLIRSAFQAAVRPGVPHPSQRELARRLGVSPRSVGRWLHDVFKPRASTLERISPALEREHKIARDTAKKINRRAEARPPRTEIPIAGERRWLTEYGAEGEKTGFLYSSDWVNYDVSTYDLRAIFDFLRGMRDIEATVQIVYQIAEGSAYVTVSGRASTTPVELYSELSDDELWEETMDRTNGGRALFVAALEPQRKKRRKRAPKKK